MFSVVLFPQAYLRGRCISKSKIAVGRMGFVSFDGAKVSIKKFPTMLKKHVGNELGNERKI